MSMWRKGVDAPGVVPSADDGPLLGFKSHHAHQISAQYRAIMGGCYVTTGNNDHRLIGRQLDLFHLQEEAAGSVFWHPRGQTLYRLIENYVRVRLEQNGYDEVRSPQLFDQSLFEKSGHIDHFRDNMFEVEDHKVLKPMNCPAHVQIFKAGNVSYKQLPLRLAEFGCCHRNEPSGALHGIMRLRQFVQDDAHIFCREQQIEQETESFCRLLRSVYSDFGFDDVEVAISLRPDDRAGDDALWDRAEAVLIETVKAVGLPYKLQPGEGAFYGPKLEFALKDRQGRQWQCGTLQLDFVLPSRLGARYTDEEGLHQVPVMVHRAILGSMERFIGILLEHYEGQLPEWLAPLQVVIIPVNDQCLDYAFRVHDALREQGARVRLDPQDEHMMTKIKRYSELLVPSIIVVGQREAEAETLAVRKLGSRKPEVLPLADYRVMMLP